MTYRDYAEACQIFSVETANWNSLDNNKFYTTGTNCPWVETADNAHGGIDVSWAFNESEDYIYDEAEHHFRNHFIRLIEQGIDENWDMKLVCQ